MVSKIVTASLIYLILILQFVSAQTEIKVMTFNVRYDELFYHPDEPSENDWNHRKSAQTGLINFHRPDIVGMQEPLWHQVTYFEKELPDYKWIGIAREDGKMEGELNPIFYNSDKIQLLESDTFWLSETPEKPSKSWDAGYTRICTWALFEDKLSKARFYVFNTHFDSKGKKARLASARLLHKKIKSLSQKLPVFVTGDFNFLPDSPPYFEMTTNGLFDSQNISESSPYGPEGTFSGFRLNETPTRRIDFIFTNNFVTVKRYGVLNDSYDRKFPSDHLPIMVIADFKENRNQSTKKTTLFKVLNWNTLYQFNHQKNVAEGINYIKSKKPNVVALQELNGLRNVGFQKMAAQWGHPFAVLLKEEGFSMGLTSDEHIDVLEKRVEGFHHGFLHVKTKGIHFFVVHLWPGKFHETEFISSKIKKVLGADEQVILLGDFNAESPLDSVYLTTKSKVTPDYKVLSTYLDLGLIDVIHKHDKKAIITNPSPLVIPKWHPDLASVKAIQRRIDFILCSPNLDKKSQGGRIFMTKKVEKISDHYPMMVKFKN